MTMETEREAALFLYDKQTGFWPAVPGTSYASLYLSLLSLQFLFILFFFPPPSSLASQGSDGVPTGCCTATALHLQ